MRCVEFDKLPETVDDLDPIRLGEPPRLIDLLEVQRSSRAELDLAAIYRNWMKTACARTA